MTWSGIEDTGFFSKDGGLGISSEKRKIIAGLSYLAPKDLVLFGIFRMYSTSALISLFLFGN